MILSVSRRTDIPAFYMDAFIRSLCNGRILSINPYNPKSRKVIDLTRDPVDCIVFWTKDPSKAVKKIEYLGDYFFYFLVTINGYGQRIEKGVPDTEKAIKGFIDLSKKIGKDRVIWRYDPIFFSETHDASFHLKNFKNIAEKLSGNTERCIISYIDIYKKIVKRIEPMGISRPSDDDIKSLSSKLYSITEDLDISIQSCSEKSDLASLGIKRGSCIDVGIINRYRKKELEYKKDKGQRKECLCSESLDVGIYDTCKYKCIYCYANR